ncbi:hypothetical protein CKO28_17405 [Rhodovibrio sodomensis]|uniref:Uncharacterized protein n=1 Tax=Rhodovibrio sodomensis TaxID=1088 RepID=A0ABS1DKC8_9PROT|nr:hypothetical protein [Rhodovibrio sodomensis]MBK1669815.1 hypothetical protein [Rhodovibrio sodomensis]
MPDVYELPEELRYDNGARYVDEYGNPAHKVGENAYLVDGGCESAWCSNVSAGFDVFTPDPLPPLLEHVAGGWTPTYAPLFIFALLAAFFVGSWANRMVRDGKTSRGAVLLIAGIAFCAPQLSYWLVAARAAFQGVEFGSWGVVVPAFATVWLVAWLCWRPKATG